MSNNQTTPAPEIGEPGTGFWSIGGLAKSLGVSPSYLYSMKNLGKLRTVAFGGTVAIPDDAAIEFRTRREERRKAREAKHTTQEGTTP